MPGNTGYSSESPADSEVIDVIGGYLYSCPIAIRDNYVKQSFAEYGLFFLYRSFGVPLVYFLPVLLETRGIVGWQTGLLMGLLYITGIVLSLPLGVLNDHRDSSLLIRASLGLSALFSIAVVWTGNFPVLIVLFILLGLGKNLFQVSFDAMFFRTIINRGGCIHAGRYQSVFSVAAFVGLALSALLVRFMELEQLYLVIGLVYLAALVPASRVKSTLPFTSELDSLPVHRISLKFSGFLILIFLFSLHFGVEDACYGLFLKHYLGISPVLSSIYMMSESITFGLTALLISRLVDHHNLSLRWLFIVGVFISGLTLVLKVNPVVIISMTMRMAHGVGDAMVLVVIYYGLSRVFRIEEQGGSAGLLSLAMVLGSFTGALVFSRVGFLYGYERSFIVAGVILMVVALLLALLMGRFRAATSASGSAR